MNPLLDWLRHIYFAIFPWLKTCSFRISVDLTTESPTATVPSVMKSAPEPIRTIRHFEVVASSLEEAREIALENARLVFSAEGYHVRELTIAGEQELAT